jgi:putative transcriptional regulator
MARKRYQSRIAESVHKTAVGLHRVGAIDKTTMREFDVMCLTQVTELSAREIRRIREVAGVSQEVFGHYLNVPTTLVSQWERGEKRPSGPSLKLLCLVKHRGLGTIA